MSEKINDIMGTTMDKIKSMASSDVVIGEPMKLSDTVTVVPVSKASYGFASGGSDIPAKNNPNLFGGGGGAGLTITPIAFLVLQDDKVRVMSISPENGAAEKAIGLVPELFDLVKGFAQKKSDNQEN